MLRTALTGPGWADETVEGATSKLPGSVAVPFSLAMDGRLQEAALLRGDRDRVGLEQRCFPPHLDLSQNHIEHAARL